MSHRTIRSNRLPSLALASLLTAALLVAPDANPTRAEEAVAEPPANAGMDQMWGDRSTQGAVAESPSLELFRDGNYAMFIHWGLYSNFAGRWDGKTYYGIGEWLMHPRMAGIPVERYMAAAKSFDPIDFDAEAIARLAKAAGMKYIVITSKHHEGFAMFDSAHPFNIVDATPFARDPMRELADACRREGLGFGFYYSHNQDWTAPGALRGPTKNADGSDATFDRYFREKCYPQVKEICTNYGPLTIVWFDTPGSMPKEHVVALRDLVRETQPEALLCSRIGHGMGDYVSSGDMEVPPENIDGLWETVDTTNDSWSFAWYDSNWKGPQQVLHRLVSTVARGGTYMLNVGPDGRGLIPAPCQEFLRSAGEWIERHPSVVYGAGPSPWGRGLPWGDVTMPDEQTLNLCVFDWPRDGRLCLPGLETEVLSAELMTASGPEPAATERRGAWTFVSLPPSPPESFASVVQLKLDGKPSVDGCWGVHPNCQTALSTHFADASGAKKSRVRWMEKFGEWKHRTQVSRWDADGAASWEVEVCQPGYYAIELEYRGEGRVVWKLETDDGGFLQNQQAATEKYAKYPLGVLELPTAGRHTISVSLVEGDRETTSLAGVTLTPIE